LTTALPEIQAAGLGGDALGDELKNKIFHNHEAVFDEDAPGHMSPIFGTTTPFIHGGPNIYLPGLWKGKNGSDHVDIQW